MTNPHEQANRERKATRLADTFDDVCHDSLRTIDPEDRADLFRYFAADPDLRRALAARAEILPPSDTTCERAAEILEDRARLDDALQNVDEILDRINQR